MASLRGGIRCLGKFKKWIKVTELIILKLDRLPIMATCAVCGQEGKLTREHTVPNGILNRLEKLPQGSRPNLIWTLQMSEIAADDNHRVKDLCEDCQQAFQKTYDDRVDEAFSILMDLQEMQPPGSITVDEPWFTLYVLRIFWNMTRSSKLMTLDSELTEPIIRYARNPQSSVALPNNYCLGISCFPSQTYPNDAGGSFNAVFYAGISPDQRIGTDKIRVRQLYMRLIGLRFLYMQVNKRHANDPGLRKYYESAVDGKNGVLLQPNSAGRVTYSFISSDPDTNDPRPIKISRGLIAGKKLSSLV